MVSVVQYARVRDQREDAAQAGLHAGGAGYRRPSEAFDGRDARSAEFRTRSPAAPGYSIGCGETVDWGCPRGQGREASSSKNPCQSPSTSNRPAARA